VALLWALYHGSAGYEADEGETTKGEGQPPPPGVLKANCDGAFIQNHQREGWGFYVMYTSQVL
jgi:hypothetical protein